MPKAAVHEDNSAKSRENDVRGSWKRTDMQTKAKTERMQCPTHDDFRTSILRSDLPHVSASLRFRQMIHSL